MKIDLYLLYPFLVGLFPLLFLWTKNIVEVSLSKFLKCAIIYCLLFTLVYIFLSYFTQSIYEQNFKMFLLVIIFYNFRKFTSKIFQLTKISRCIRHAGFLVCLLACFFIQNEPFLTFFAMIMTAMIVITTFFLVLKVITFIIHKHKNVETSFKENSFDVAQNKKDIKQEELPDIYFLMPDGYANHNILKEKFNYDNSNFINFLKQKNFDVCDDAIANYTFTEPSMGSTINLNYVESYFKLDKNVGYQENMQNYLKFYVNNYLVKLLQENNYNFIHLLNQTEKEWGFVNQEGAVEILPKSLNEFEKVLLRNTLFGYFAIGSMEKENQQNMLNYFYELEHISKYENDKPSFVYAHIFSPHTPYLFDEKGNLPPKELDWMILEDNNKLYLKQLTYLNGRLKSTINNILNNGRKRKKVIIIQSDHGCCMHPDTVNKYMDQNIWDQRRFVLRAIYSDKELDFDFKSNVNLFRSIFNTYLGTKFNKLEEITCYSDNSELSNELFNFQDGRQVFKE